MEEGPAKWFALYCDFDTAALSVIGTLAVILHRIKTGEGQVVERSLPGTALTFNNAPQLDQHTEEILLELGYTADDINRLRDSGIV